MTMPPQGREPPRQRNCDEITAGDPKIAGMRVSAYVQAIRPLAVRPLLAIMSAADPLGLFSF